MNVLVTGAAGFIGSRLAGRLVEAGHHVRALDDLSTGRIENLAAIMGRIEFIKADLADRDVARSAARDMEVVFHQAGLPSVPRAQTDPSGTHRANVDATFAILSASVSAGARRLIYAASSSVYGEADRLPKREDMPARPMSLYALQKHLGELYGRLYAERYGLEVFSLRYFNVYGPHQDASGEYAAVIPKFALLMLRGKRPTIYGDGRTSRDFTYIDDAVEANVLAMEADNADGRSINIGSGERHTLNELCAALNSILRTNLEPHFLPAREGDIRDSLADISRARAILGYAPRVSFADGLARTVVSLQEAALPQSVAM